MAIFARFSRRVTSQRRLLLLAMLILALFPAWPLARPATPAPPLPAPSGAVVNVSTEAQLQSAVSKLASNTTIVLAPGTYKLTSTLYINGTFSNVGIRGGTDNRDDVVLVGPGMTNASYGNTPFGIWTGGNVNGVTIANLTVRDVYDHPIIFNAGTQSPRLYNVHLIDAGQQFIKSNPDASGVGASNGVVEYSVLEYTTTAPSSYTNGVDIHGGANWIIRHNLFKNIQAPAGQLAGPVVLAWNHSSNTITEGNTFLNCARGIAYGLNDVSGTDHSGGIIRNNFFYRSSSQPGDVAIQVADSPNTQVLNNTVMLSGTYGSAIEYRFTGTTGVVIANNLLDGIVQARDGATGSVQNNLTGATASMFVNPAAGDLHLKTTATSAIDRGTTLANVTDDWDGNVRPAGAGPDLGADEAGATATTYAIGGHVRDGFGTAVSAVTVALGGARSATTTTDASGAYAFSSLAGGVDYTVTPSKSGYTFTPAGLTYASLSGNQSTVDFTAAAVIAAPTVSLTAPASGASVVAGSAMTISASANAASGRTIASVQFYTGTTLIGTDTTSPYGITWTPATAGSYSLTARATDSGGSISTSAARTVTVTAPASGSTAYSGTPAPIPGTIQFEDFDNGAEGTAYHDTTSGNAGGVYRTSVGVDIQSTTPSGYNLGWVIPGEWLNYSVNVAAAGAYTVNFRVASSGAGGTFHLEMNGTNVTGPVTVPNTGGWQVWTTVSKTVTLSGGTQVARLVMDSAAATFVGNVDWMQFVSGTSSTVSAALTAPASGSSYSAPATIAIAGNASTTSGTMSKVDFYSGTTLIGSDTVAPFTFSWGNVAAGTYALTAVATTSGGATATSAPISVTVTAATTATVTVGLTAPVNGSSYSAPATIPIAANASTTSGSVSKVEFFNGSTMIGTATASPYSFSWGNVAAGSYTVSAKVTTSGGATATSAAAAVSVAPAASTPPTGRISGLTEVCTFKLPAGNFGGKNGGFDYGGSALALNPATGRLVLTGHVYDQMSVEVTIPACGGTATVIGSFTDALEGKLGAIGTGTDLIGGHLYYNGKLYMSGFIYYDGSGAQTLSHFVRPADLSVKGQVTGPFRAGSQGAGWYSGYMTAVPAEWQGALGGPALTGNCCLSIISRTSYGPSISSFDPEHLGSATTLVGYDQGHQTLGTYGATGSHPSFNGTTRIKGVVFPPGSSSVIFTGRTGTGNYCYGEAAACGDSSNGSKGEHAYPYALYAWAYDANDLAAVKAGTKQPWQITPYAEWTLPGNGNSEYSGASAYDPATGRIYVVQQEANGALPIVHVLIAK